MTDAELIARLEDGTLPESEFRHAAHVRAAYIHLRESGFAGAIERMGAAIRGYAAARGKAGLYHETITVAFLVLINERLRLSGDGSGWVGFAAAHPELLDRACLTRYYRPETLATPRARQVFVLDERG
jgi:hypothetical protein